MLDEILARLNKLDEKELQALEQEIDSVLPDQIWYPDARNQPQVNGYYSEADELFYGGQAGGGKSDLILGLSLTAHHRSLILREYLDDARDLANRALEIIGNKKGFNSQLMELKIDGRLIEFGGCRNDEEKERFKGKPHDLIAFDEICDFSEERYKFITIWNRSSKQGQRVRVVATGNPPTRPEGAWVIRYWAAWLDPKHPNPAKEGELRWYTTVDGKDVEVNGRGPHVIDGEEVFARSRTFIRAKLSDNPYLGQDYEATLASLPEAYRRAYRDGRFDLALEDQSNQVIPTAWVQAAFARWEARRGLKPEGIPMCSIGLDCSGGGKDEAVTVPRYDYHYGRLNKFKTVINEYGSQMAGEVIKIRRDQADVGIDMGGGYGSGVWAILKENIGAEHLKSYVGGSGAMRRTQDGKLGFTNLRSQAYWELAQDLNPDQEGGSLVELPPDNRLLAGLTAPTYTIKRTEIQIEPKEKIIERLGFSPNEADAVVMARWAGRHNITPETRQTFNHRPQPKLVDKYAHRRGVI